jgi:tRNA A-37 threonylcarbamoyl transferase component Bud32
MVGPSLDRTSSCRILREMVEGAALARFGRYEVLRRLGGGGAAEVFEARHVELNKRVALKVTHPALVTNEKSVERVLREGRVATAIRHPHVVDVLDVGIEHHTPYLVMELLEGEDLADFLSRTGPLSVEEAAELLLPVVSGVCAVHRAGIVHRDLKPSNILLARRHRGVEPVVVDFGISKSTVSYCEPPTSSEGAVGTVPYMSPEQIRGASPVTPKCDQYALGVVLYECVTGGTPFWSDDRYELLHAIMTGPVVPPSQVNTMIPATFDTVILRALARDPKARFESAHALGEALWPFAGPRQREKWSAEFGPVVASVRGEPEETSTSLMAYSRAARGAGGSIARLRAACTIISAIGCAATVCIFVVRARVVNGTASSAALVATSSTGRRGAKAEDRTHVAVEGEPSAEREHGSVVVGGDRGRSSAVAPRVASSPAPPPQRMTPRAEPSARIHLEPVPHSDSIQAPTVAIDPLDLR